MSQTGHEAVHEITINAAAADVFELIADVRHWPVLFPPTVHVDHMWQSGQSERIRIWATANGEIKSWTSRRTLDPGQTRIEFMQEVTMPPVAAMGGTWLIEPVSRNVSRVRLRHVYRAVDDDPRHVAWIGNAVNTNSRTELAALKAGAEKPAGADADLTFSFEDTVLVAGAGKDVYDFLNDAQLWDERLPHVARAVLTEDSPGLQILELDTRMKDGSAHTTKSVRVCFPYNKIVYKQVSLPALMTLHTGCWTVAEEPAGGGPVAVTSRHTVTIDKASIGTILGPHADVRRAREFVRDALSANSLTTLTHAKKYAESRR